MSFFTKKNPSKGLYILIWCVAFISSNIIVTILDEFLAGAIIKSIDQFNTYVLIALPIEVVVAVSIIVFVYRKFPNLKMSKVMPWIYFFTALNFARTYSESKEILDPLNIDLTVFNVGLLLSYFAYVYGIRHFFVNTKQWK